MMSLLRSRARLSRASTAMRPLPPSVNGATFLMRATSTAVRPVPKEISILYGSQTGNGMGFAMQLSEALGDTAGFSASVTDLYEYAPKELLEVPPEQGVVFVVSCFGKGEPTDSAKKFFAWLTDSARDAENAARLASGQPPLLGHLNYTLFGLGSSQTHNQHYNVIGRRLDARLQELGGQCFFKRGEGDDSGVLELDFEKWQQELLAAATGGDAAPADAALAAPSNPAAASRPGALASAAPMAASASSAPSAARPKTCESLDKPLTFAAAESGNGRYCSAAPASIAVVPLSDITGVDPALLPSAVLAGGKRVLHPAGVTGMSNLSPLGSGEFKPIFEMALAARAAPGAAFPPGSELTYHTGDHVSVMPQGSEAAALALCDRLGWDPALRFAIEATKPGVKLPFTAPTTLLNALTRHVDVGAAVTPQMLRVLGSQAANAAEASALAQLASDATAYTKQVRQRYVRLLDVLHAFPSVHLPLDRLLAAWPLIVPRYYSICSAEPLGSSSGSSSGPSRMLVSFKQLRMAVDGQAPGTHAQLEAGAFQAAAAIRRHAERTGRASGAPGHPGGRVFEGLASTYMATRRLGDEVDVSVRHSSFRLPEDPSVPVCMIAGGIGITPFRAFLEHRVSRVLASAGSGAPVRYGPSMLLLGCRNETDHVYGDIARQALFCGALTRYDVAYAVPTAGSAVAPRLADELILSHGQAIWDALRVGGIVYVCGGASGFGMAVARAVKRVIAQHGGMSAEASEAYMAQLLEGCRFLEDLAD